MPAAPRPRRAALTVPAHRDRMLARAASTVVDELVLDLEDGVPAGDKQAARRNCVGALGDLSDTGALRAVRVNGWDSPWALTDVRALVAGAGQHLDAIVLPKVESRDQVVALDLVLTQLERTCGLPVGGIAVEAQIESAAGVARLAQIARASPRLAALVLGPGDLAASLGMPATPIGAPQPAYPGDHWHAVRTLLVVHARANGLQAVDGPFAGLDAPKEHAGLARRARALGFDGMWVIHPEQIPVATAAFSATAEELAQARQVLAAVEARDGGAGRHAGQMVDEASRRMARAVLARAPDRST